MTVDEAIEELKKWPSDTQVSALKLDLIRHASDCAIHNAPALPVGPCDCGASAPSSPMHQCPVCARRVAIPCETLAIATSCPLSSQQLGGLKP